MGRMIGRRRVPLMIAAMVVAGSASPVRSASQATPAPAPCAPGQRIGEQRFVPIGGIDQWITITGENCANPVILFVHGGPGNPLSPYADSLFAGWEKDFTLVQWDQRGSGWTYARKPPAAGSMLTLERMIADGVAVAEYLTRRLGTPKVILVGGSWGSVLAVHMARARPDLFHAYVGFAQMVSYRENPAASYASTIAAARAAGDEATVAALEALGSPPWKNPRSFGILRRATRVYEAKTTDPAPGSWWVRPAVYDTPELRESYEEGEDYSYLQFVGLQGDGMFSRVDLPALGSDFRLPVYIVQGAEDLVTVPEIAKRYFDRIAAPDKQFVLVPRTGHDPNRAMLAAVHALITRAARLIE